jgi:sulfoxide reductase catalytic subunit YedY
MIKIKRSWEIPESEVTPESLYLRRREFIKTGGLIGGALLLNPLAAAQASIAIGDYQEKVVSLDEEITEEEDATSYNNFYEFGTGKEDPKKHSQRFQTDDWQIVVSGECEKSGTYGLEDLVKPFPIEERIYRLRCVEAWSMVIPWLGIPMGSILSSLQPTSRAKYVALKTLHDPVRMPGQQRSVLNYVRQNHAQSERRANSTGGAVEIWFQKYQVDRRHRVHRGTTADLVEYRGSAGVRLLLERQSASRPSALVAET